MCIRDRVYTPIIKIMCRWHLKCIFCVLGAVNQTLDDLLLFKKAQNDLNKVSTVRILQKERQLCFVNWLRKVVVLFEVKWESRR